jgi:hypothetical protein
MLTVQPLFPIWCKHAVLDMIMFILFIYINAQIQTCAHIHTQELFQSYPNGDLGHFWGLVMCVIHKHKYIYIHTHTHQNRSSSTSWTRSVPTSLWPLLRFSSNLTRSRWAHMPRYVCFFFVYASVLPRFPACISVYVGRT